MSRTKDGISYLSQIIKTPVLPVALIGADMVLPKGRLFPCFYPLEVRIGEVIPPPSSLDRGNLKTHTSLVCSTIITLANFI